MFNHAVILVVDDREDDRYIIKLSFAKAGIVNPMHFVHDGEEAIAYLMGDGKYSRRDEFPLPTLMLLDLKMPRCDGFDVLAWVRQQPELKSLRVILLTGSEDQSDINRAYDLGANSFLVKPLNFESFIQISRAINGYWLLLDKPPASSRPARETEPGNNAP